MAYQPTGFRGEITAEELHFYLERELLAISRELTGSEGSALPPIYDIRDFADGPEIGAAGRAAIAAAVADGVGGRIYIPAGTWDLTFDNAVTPTNGFSARSIWLIEDDNIWFEGDGYGTLLNLHNAGTANIGLIAMNWQGANPSVTKSGATTRGSRSVTVGTGQTIPVGTRLMFSGDDSAGYFHFFIGIVSSYNSGTGALVLRDPAVASIPSANLSIHDVSAGFIKGGGARNLRLNAADAKQTTTNSAWGIYAQNTWHWKGENLWFEEFSGNAPSSSASSGITMFAGYECVLKDIHASRSGSGSGGDIYPTWQHALSADNLHSEWPAGFGPTFLGVSACDIGRIRCTGASDSGRAIKFAGAIECTVESCIVQGSFSTGIAITEGSQRNLFGKMIAVQDNAITSGQNVGIWCSDQNNQENYFEAMHSLGWSENDVEFYDSDTGNVVGYIRCDRLYADGSPHVMHLSNPVGTVAGLPTVTATTFGFGVVQSRVTDSNTIVFRATIGGGGSNVIPVFWNGANWCVG